jgi:CheY-like chemotaxis protein
MRQAGWDRLTVMVVEDNRFMRDLLCATLNALGIESIIAEDDGASAIRRLKLSRTNPKAAGLGTVDIILADYVMPVVDGVLLLRWLRTGSGVPDRFVPLIMVSGAADREVVEQARDAGVTEFLAKPYSARTLADRLLMIINQPRPYILAQGYFGPDRRRMNTAVEKDRRSPDAAGIQVIHKASNEKTLREDVRAIQFRIGNRLHDKLGANLMKGEIDIDPAFIRAAEERIKSFFGDYADWVERHIRSMIDSRNALAVGEGDASTHIANINTIAHELRGQSGIFDYPLITHIAKSLYDATLSPNIEVTGAWIELIGAHIDTIRAVFSDKISGTGGEVGAALLHAMEIAVKKFAGTEVKKRG